MSKKSIKVNAILNVIKSMLSVIFPLITYPYATRVLGVENLGKVTFSSSFITYFSLLATLGITTYAIREGSKLREERVKFTQFANEIFSINIVTTFVAYILLVIILIFFYKIKQYRLLILIHSISIIFTTFGIDWINSIFEDYTYITMRSIIINIISMICLFTFVKKENDYYIYAALTVLSNGIVCLCNFFYCKRYVKLKFTLKNNFVSHIRCMLVFFANSVAVSIYVNADTTMLGILVNDYSLGLYSVSVKIYSILKNIFAAMYMVTIPKLTYMNASNQKFEYKKLLTKISSIIILLLLPCSAGLIILSKDIVLILAGNSYIEASISLSILGGAIIFALLGGILTQCVNITLNREKITLKATVWSSILNIILNFYFINKFAEIGAAITTLFSELFVLIFCLVKFKDLTEYIDRDKIVKDLITASIEMMLIIGIGIVVNRLVNYMILKIILTVFMSIIAYLLILFITKNETFMEVLKKIAKENE